MKHDVWSPSVPPKGQSTGFKDRNRHVGHTWSSYNQDEHYIFSPKIFEQLCEKSVETQNAILSNPAEPPNCSALQPTTVNSTKDNQPLSPDQLTKYMPIFLRLVNLKTVARDFKHGRLCRKSGKSQHLELVAREELKKIVKQV